MICMMGGNVKFMIWGWSVTQHKKKWVLLSSTIFMLLADRDVVWLTRTLRPRHWGVVGTSTLQPYTGDHLVDVPTTARHEGGGCGGDIPTTSWHEGGRADRTEQHGRRTLPQCR